MPTYHYVRDPETGESRMKMVTPEAPPQEGLPQPDSLPQVESAELKEVHRCILCNQDYAIAALAAKHFHNEHSDIDESKDTWRAYIEKVEVVA